MPIAPPEDLPVFTSAALRRLEATHADLPLMERAGAAAACLAVQLRRDAPDPVLVIAGPGNNGGDAFVMARLLQAQSIPVEVVFFGDAERLPADAKSAFERFIQTGGEHRAIPSGQRYSLVVDGLFGIGLTRPVEGAPAELLTAAEDAARTSACPLLALDMPSGLDADTGCPIGYALRATHTLTFLGLKPGLLTGDGPDFCGEITVDPLNVLVDDTANGRLISAPHEFQNLASLLRRPQNSHKGNNGAAGVLGGNDGMTGAALLTARAALNSGAGRVYVGLLAAHAPVVDFLQPELMLRPAEQLFEAPLTAHAVGPGMGITPQAQITLAQALAQPIPLLLDADALNLLAQHSSLADACRQRGAASRFSVLTPHPGEAERLLRALGANPEDSRKNRLAAALKLATGFQAWTVLKGNGSIVAAPDGRWWINTSGNPALATAGSGDVLSGIIAGLLAQLAALSANAETMGAAVRIGVHLHGLAADTWVSLRGGPTGLAAGELIPLVRDLLNHELATTGYQLRTVRGAG